MDYAELVDEHIDSRADITIAAQPVGIDDASCDGHLPLRSHGTDRVRSRRSRTASGSRASAAACRRAPSCQATATDKPFIASMGVYVFSREVLLEILTGDQSKRFRPRSDSRGARALQRAGVSVPRLLGRRRHRAVVLRRQHHAHPARRAVPVLRRRSGRSTRTRASCRARGSATARSATRIIAEGCSIDRATIARFGRRHPDEHRRPAAAIRRSVLLGADYYETDDVGAELAAGPALGIGRDVVLDRVIVDKNARIGDGVRLVNEQRLAARRRRRLLHPRRHHRRAEGRHRQGRDDCLRGSRDPRGRTRCRTGARHGQAFSRYRQLDLAAWPIGPPRLPRPNIPF